MRIHGRGELQPGLRGPARWDWALAERDWLDIVALVLDSDGVDCHATGGKAIKQAVEAAAAFMMDDELWPWCPMCKRGTDVDPTGGTDER